ncbi:MAG: hypothetical protein SGARI_001833, partial [Bacillariaceae sp.]
WKQLFGVISSGSVSLGGNASTTNAAATATMSAAAAAIVMGPRGSGKSLLLESCLAALQHRLNNHSNNDAKQKLPRRVTIHGVLSKGHDVTTVVYEIIRQLSELAFQEGTNGEDVDDNITADDRNTLYKRKRRKRYHHDKHLLRLRQNSNFTSNLQLLEEVLKIADADGIPILLVLDELDAFLSTENNSSTSQKSHHQLLLYLLLDRVATPGSNLILVMQTSSFSCLSLLEKRIRSRAEGTCHVIYTSAAASYKEMVESVLKSKLANCVVAPQILARVSYDGNSNNDNSAAMIPEKVERSQATHITSAMERQFRLGKDVRWFSRVLSTCLALYRQECIMNGVGDSDAVPPDFHCQHLHTALLMMGATAIGSDIQESNTTSGVAATRQPDFCVVQDDNSSTAIAVDPRLQALLDLSTPQLVLLLSAKRILTRQSHLRGNGREPEHGNGNKSNKNGAKNKHASSPAVPTSLTVDRMIHEYESFRKRSSNIAAYSKALWKTAALQLLQVGLFVPVDSTNNANNSNASYGMTAPALYYKKAATKSYRNLDTPTLMGKLALRIPLEMDRELAKALSSGTVLQCPTALREWGKSANN